MNISIIVVSLMVWLCTNTGFDKCKEVVPPPISFHYQGQLSYTYHGKIVKVKDNLIKEVMAVYIDDAPVPRILLDRDLRDDEDQLKLTLVHELYHHLQKINGVDFSCKPIIELPAYRIEKKYADEIGVEFEIPFIAYLIQSLCETGR